VEEYQLMKDKIKMLECVLKGMEKETFNVSEDWVDLGELVKKAMKGKKIKE
jgi:hypothetical protein